MKLSRIESYFLNKIIKRVVSQGGHCGKLIWLFDKITDAFKNEFTEDNSTTQEDMLVECLCENFKSIKYDSNKMKLIINGKYYVKGDHSTLKRPDKYNLSFNEATIYSNFLKSVGFTNVEILTQEKK